MDKNKEKKIVCRCEEITEEEIIEAIDNGADNLDAIKRTTRAGMGLCGGRTCSRIIARIISQKTGKPVSEIVSFTSRPPVRPVSIKLLGEYKQLKKNKKSHK